MDKQIHFSVTQSDIDQGKTGNPRQCAIARAFRRATGATNVSANYLGLDWTMPGGNRYTAEMPDKAHYLMLAFDSGYAEPTDLVIDTPSYYV